MRVQSNFDPLGWAATQAVRAGPADFARPGSGFDRQRRLGERDRRRGEPRRSPAIVPDDARTPDPCTALAATVAALGIGTPVEAQACCRHVTAAYTEED